MRSVTLDPETVNQLTTGEMEITMFNTFIVGQQLRAGIVDRTWSQGDVQARLRDAFLATFESDRRGTLLNDIWAFDDEAAPTPDAHSTSSTLTEDIYALLQNRLNGPSSQHRYFRQTVLVQPTITKNGVTFSTFRNSPGNSHVVYGPFSDGRWSAGRIVAIFFWPHTDSESIACLVVEPFRELEDAETRYDPYRLFHANASGKLFHASFERPIVLLIQDIVCHFASTPYHITQLGTDVIHALPLDRVSILILGVTNIVVSLVHRIKLTKGPMRSDKEAIIQFAGFPFLHACIIAPPSLVTPTTADHLL